MSENETLAKLESFKLSCSTLVQTVTKLWGNYKAAYESDENVRIDLQVFPNEDGTYDIYITKVGLSIDLPKIEIEKR